MADEQNKNLFSRLSDLFSSNIVVRKTPTGKLKVKQTDSATCEIVIVFIRQQL